MTIIYLYECLPTYDYGIMCLHDDRGERAQRTASSVTSIIMYLPTPLNKLKLYYI